MEKDYLYMSRCIELAQLGAGYVSPNPMVGAVIVHNDRIIGEGYHQRYGESHAEVNAIESVQAADRPLLTESTIYVSLEPCCHWGKTPPCCERIIREGIPRVVIGMEDPFGKVCGNGILRLRESGCAVTVGVLEEECRELNRRFITAHTLARPYIILKWAETADGFIDSDRLCSQTPLWFTGHSCRTLVHRYRSEEDAIWVGKNTVLRDNPELTNRHWYGNHPLRVTMDNHNHIDTSFAIRNHKAETIVFEHRSIEAIIEQLQQRNVQSVLVEGGAFLLNYLIKNNLYDEIRRFVSPYPLNHFCKSDKGLRAPLLENAILKEQTTIGKDTLLTYRNKN